MSDKEQCPHWKDARNLKSDFRDQLDGDHYCNLPAPTPSPKFSSEDLLLLAHDEWKRREERKHNHQEQDWVAGFISGFCTSRQWARECVDGIREKVKE
jgi:hypothetical protein